MSKWIFKSSCPACPDDDIPSTWTRVRCGHKTYIWDDCDIGCPECFDYSFILDNKFICSNHSTESREPNIQALLRCIAVVAQMVHIPYLTFKKMEKKIEEEGRKRGLNIDYD